jgi:cellulose synthase/poly-beta-1,6-N-acetylglucosamine synthase-like glycosyltransferase
MKKITIGIAGYNEEKTIRKSIQSGLDSKPPVSEVIVVASGCTDGTENEIRKAMEKDPRVKLIVEKSRRGKGSAINRILLAATGDLIVMTDADLTYDPDSINELIKKFDKNTGVVSGRPQYYAKNPMFDWWGEFASECASRQRIAREKKGFRAISGYLYALRSGIVDKIPHSAKSEDAFIGELVGQAGYKIGYAPKAVVNVGYAENLRDYLTQKVRTHYGHIEVFKAAGAKNAIDSIKMAGGLRSEIREYFRIAKEFIKSPIDYCYFCLYLVTEATIWIIAFLKYYLKGKEEWKQILSTKKL